MLDLTKLPANVLAALRQRCGYAADDATPDAWLHHWSAEQAFTAFCEWHGLRGWGPTLIDAVHACEAAAGADASTVPAVADGER